MKASNGLELVEVYAGTAFEAGMVKSLLSNAEIDSFLKDENVGTIIPWWAAPGGAGAVKILVPKFNEDISRLIIAEFEKNQVH